MITHTKNKVKRTDFKLVAIDETTHWREDIATACGKIVGVYMYNKNEHTFLCELAPSYSLIHLYSFAEREISDAIEEELMNGDSLSNDATYVHVSLIEQMQTQTAPRNLNGTYYENGGRKYRDIMMIAEEYLKCNRQI